MANEKHGGPAKALKVIYCDKCGRDDMVTPLNPRHFSKGELCDGKLKTAIYRREK